MALCFAAVLVCTTGTLRFYRYRKVLPHLMQREGLFAAVFSVNLLSFMVTAIGLIRIYNFRVTNLVARSDLFVTMLADGVASAGVLTCAIVLLMGSGGWKESIRRDMQNVIKNAFESPDFAEEINQVQAEFECCGTSINDSRPMQIWLDTLNADSAFRDEVFAGYGHLPWSCCSRQSASSCEHIRFSRYLPTLDETAYEHYSTYANQVNKKWECTSLEECKKKQTSALRSVNTNDCVDSFFSAFRLHFFVSTGTAFLLLGLYMSVTTTMCFLVNRTVNGTS
uniref:Tetraspanin n=1 Tax=Ascaris lumbricoides TaxID=6252 RepID=A0A9J2P8D8_ASCLU